MNITYHTENDAIINSLERTMPESIGSFSAIEHPSGLPPFVCASAGLTPAEVASENERLAGRWQYLRESAENSGGIEMQNGSIHVKVDTILDDTYRSILDTYVITSGVVAVIRGASQTAAFHGTGLQAIQELTISGDDTPFDRLIVGSKLAIPSQGRAIGTEALADLAAQLADSQGNLPEGSEYTPKSSIKIWTNLLSGALVARMIEVEPKSDLERARIAAEELLTKSRDTYQNTAFTLGARILRVDEALNALLAERFMSIGKENVVYAHTPILAADVLAFSGHNLDEYKLHHLRQPVLPNVPGAAIAMNTHGLAQSLFPSGFSAAIQSLLRPDFDRIFSEMIPVSD